MFRHQQQQKMEEQVVSRIYSYPVISDSITQVGKLYELTKEKSNLVRYTLEKAESVASTVVASTKEPVLDRYGKQIASINSIALNQLDKLEEKYPIITKPTSEVYQEGVKTYDSSSLKPTVDRVIGATKTGVNKVYEAKDYGVQTVETVRKYSAEKVNNMKDYGIEKVSGAFKTPYGQVVAGQVDKFLDTADGYVDYYLPKNPESENEEEPGEDKDTVKKALTVSNKLRRRMYGKSLKGFTAAKQRSQEALEKLHFTVDLIQYTQTGLTATQQKLWNTWEEINKPVDDESVPEEEDQNPTMERRAILVARRLTTQLKSGIESLTLKAIEAPAYVQDAIEKSTAYSEDLYNYFKKVTHFDETSRHILDQNKDKIVYIQDTLKSLTDFAIASWPLKALIANGQSSDTGSGNVIEMESMNSNGE